MRITSIFEIIKPNLWAARFEYEGSDLLEEDWEILNKKDEEKEEEKDPEPEGQVTHELNRTFGLLQNYKWLWNFFNKYQKDLTDYEPGMKVKAAASSTREHAQDFHQELMDCFTQQDQERIQAMFQPLDNREKDKPEYDLQQLKGKKTGEVNWIRLYGVRYGSTIIITGFGIKLVDHMKGRPHLKRELVKMEMAVEHLRQQGHEATFVYKEI